MRPADPASLPSLAVLIVTYNRLDALRGTLARTLAEGPDRVLVVDNASTDGTGDWLAAQDDPRVERLRLSENLGGAGGFAAGLAALHDAAPTERQAGAVQTGKAAPPDWVVLYDDDAYPCPGAFDRFRAAAATLPRETGVVAAAVVHPGGGISEMNRPGRNPFWHLRSFLGAVLGGGRRGFHVTDDDLAAGAAPREIDVASFIGYFVRRETVARAGLPEAGLFLYGDDVLYSLRIRRAGLGIRLDPAIRFEHDCVTMDAGYVYRPLWKIYYHCRNGVQIAREAAGPVVFPAALAWYVIVWWRRGRHCGPAERPLYRRMMWSGLADGLRGRRGRNPAVHRIGLETGGALR